MKNRYLLSLLAIAVLAVLFFQNSPSAASGEIPTVTTTAKPTPTHAQTLTPGPDATDGPAETAVVAPYPGPAETAVVAPYPGPETLDRPGRNIIGKIVAVVSRTIRNLIPQ